jgi:arylsulfatase A-like enzyme
MLKMVPAAAAVMLVAIVASAGAASAGAASADHACDRPADRPNVILCMADDMGWADPAYMGNRVAKTPNLDRMAESGLRFRRFYSAAPVCSPTRGSCLTGRHPFRYGVFFANVGHLPAEEITLAESLRDRGYATGHFGKWHLGTLSQTDPSRNRGSGKAIVEHFSPPWLNGFDVCFSTEAKVPTWDPMIGPEKFSSWWDPVADASGAVPFREPYRLEDGSPATDNLEGDDSRVIMDRVIPFVREAVRQKRPFLAVVWFHAPHLPVVSGPKYTGLYAAEEKYAQHYFGCITALDEQVGRLRRELRGLGVADNTMFWYASDNGPEGTAGSAPGSAGPLRGRKRSLFEGGIRVPGILEWPARVEPGSVTDVPACTSDYLPTVVDVLGLEMPDDRPLDGVSLLPLVEGRMLERPRPIAFESGGQLALVDNRYKLVRARQRGRKQKGKGQEGQASSRSADEAGFMLFDLADDPGETKDLAAEKPEIVGRMKEILLPWRESCKRSLAGEDYR